MKWLTCLSVPGKFKPLPLSPQEAVARGQWSQGGAAECQNGASAAPCWYGDLQTLHAGFTGGDPTTT